MKKAVIVERNRKKVKLNKRLLEILLLLEADLRATAGKPHGRGWDALGPLRQLGENFYHCHLSPSYVVVWKLEENTESILCRIIYAGTRENAPY